MIRVKKFGKKSTSHGSILRRSLICTRMYKVRATRRSRLSVKDLGEYFLQFLYQGRANSSITWKACLGKRGRCASTPSRSSERAKLRKGPGAISMFSVDVEKCQRRGYKGEKPEYGVTRRNVGLWDREWDTRANPYAESIQESHR